MPFDFTEVWEEAAASNPDNVTHTDTITLNHSTFPAPVRLALTDKDVTLDGDLYEGIQFDSTLPVMEAKSSGGLVLNIADIDFNIGSLLDAVVATLEPMSVLWKSFLSTQTVAQAEFSKALEATGISLNGRSMQVTATYPDIINKKVPDENYTLNDFPGLR